MLFTDAWKGARRKHCLSCVLADALIIVCRCTHALFICVSFCCGCVLFRGHLCPNVLGFSVLLSHSLSDCRSLFSAI